MFHKENSACREAWQIPHFAFWSEVTGTTALKCTHFMARVETGSSAKANMDFKNPSEEFGSRRKGARAGKGAVHCLTPPLVKWQILLLPKAPLSPWAGGKPFPAADKLPVSACPLSHHTDLIPPTFPSDLSMFSHFSAPKCCCLRAQSPGKPPRPVLCASFQ